MTTWDEIILDIQEIITRAGANPDEADEKLLRNLTDKMSEYLETEGYRDQERKERKSKRTK